MTAAELRHRSRRPARARWSSTCATPASCRAGAIAGRPRTSRWPNCPAAWPRSPPTGRSSCYCAGGYRSSVAASLLRREGYPDVSDLLGGYQAWTALTQPVA